MIGIGRLGRLVRIGLPFVWLALFFLLPLLIVLKIALAQSAIRISPMHPVFVAATLSNSGYLSDRSVSHPEKSGLSRCLQSKALRLILARDIHRRPSKGDSRGRSRMTGSDETFHSSSLPSEPRNQAGYS
jgi:hypothetical protein